MAVKEFLVIGDIQQRGLGPNESGATQKFEGLSGQKQWNGANAESWTSDAEFQDAQVAIIRAVSVGEAAKAYKQIYGGSYSGKVFAVEKSSMTEG
jgi:hypothetical protein